MRQAFRYLATATVALTAAGLTLTVAKANPGTAGAQIKSLDCASQPEVVAITNLSQETQVMTGWRLLSDPPDQQSFDLGVIGALSPGETVYIESGPNAQGAFIWSHDEIFRDGDSTDYARLVSAEGTFFDEFRCPAAATQPASPTPTPGANLVPNGGGPPLPRGASRLPLAVGAGSLLSALGLAVIVAAAAGSWAARQPALATALPSDSGRMARRPKEGRRQRGSGRLWLAAAILALAAAASLAIADSPRRRRR